MSSPFALCCPCAYHEEVDEGPPFKAGVLTKQGDGGRRRWVDRHVVLDDRRFLYRESEAHDGPVRQAVEITASCTAEIVEDLDEGCMVLEVTIPHADLVWRLQSRTGGLPDLHAWQSMLVRAIRPRWRASKECNVCQGRFGLLRWRHHCRRCGFCVCAGCSSVATDLSWLGYAAPERTCHLCTAGASGPGGVKHDPKGSALGGGGGGRPTVTLRLQAQGQDEWGVRQREPLLPRAQGGDGGGVGAVMQSAAQALSSLIAPGALTGGVGAGGDRADPAGVTAAPSHAERIRVKYGIIADPKSGRASVTQRGGSSAGAGNQSSSSTCVICLEREAIIAALPCGHKCLCAPDSQRVGLRSPCPVCRAPIQQFQRIY